ncbi:hypothetical protein I656_03200 [Geobacillus sp. WSUCF1]|nr:hypothetical protein I656_03200 [Geobacillus sp. WSUCF1]
MCHPRFLDMIGIGGNSGNERMNRADRGGHGESER